jgi:tRNA pseudouridine13 synthase
VTAALPRAHGGAPLRAMLRRHPADFEVEELPAFVPDGQGEHAFLWVQKTGANTEWVARQLAAAAGVAPAAIGFAGLKDRHAITRQAFSVHLPGRAGPDWGALEIAGVEVLSATRHSRKLKRGAHRGNRFRIRLREASGDRAAFEARIAALRTFGAPNYFGEQRFGHGGGNLALARALFSGKRLARTQRGMALSAARSSLFNAVLAARVADGSWDRALEGEVWMLRGTHAVFGPEPLDDALRGRLESLDIHPTGPLWGAGSLRSEGVVRALEAAVAARSEGLAQGLEQAGLTHERRALRLVVDDLQFAWEGGDAVLAFSLEAGAYATAVLREACEWEAGGATCDDACDARDQHA